MNKIVIYTAIFGDYDNLRDPDYISKDYDYFCFTDNQKLQSNTWKINLISKTEDPVRTAKYYKIHPHLLFQDYDYSLWIDANIILQKEIEPLIEALEASQKALMTFQHEEHSGKRNCIYDEAETMTELKRDHPETIKKQISKYKKEGYPENNGLISSGVMLRKHNSSELRKPMDDWFLEIETHSLRDQISFNYIAHKNNLEYSTFPWPVIDNPYFKLLKGHKNKS
jgi:hypothetical protein